MALKGVRFQIVKKERIETGFKYGFQVHDSHHYTSASSTGYVRGKTAARVRRGRARRPRRHSPRGAGAAGECLRRRASCITTPAPWPSRGEGKEGGGGIDGTPWTYHCIHGDKTTHARLYVPTFFSNNQNVFFSNNQNVFFSNNQNNRRVILKYFNNKRARQSPRRLPPLRNGP